MRSPGLQPRDLADTGDQSPQSTQRCQDLLRLGVVAEGLADVDKQVDVAGTEDEAATELERILTQPVLPVPAGHGTFARLHVVGSHHVQHRALLEADRTVSPPLVVDQQRESDAGVLLERPCITGIAEPDRGEPGSGPDDLFFVVTQLRDMLAAEDSTVVTEEDQNSRPLLPQRTESDLLTVRVG